MPENRLLACLPEEERQRLHPYLEEVTLESGRVLAEFDRPIRYVYFLDGAVTSTLVRTPHGGAIEVGLMGAEGFVGLSLVCGVERSNGTVVVQVPGHALRMSAADFKRHVGEHGGPCFETLLRYVNYFQVVVQQHAACNAVHGIEERVCRWILLMHDRAGSDEFPLTHENLSLMLGVRRATVTEVAHGLKVQGLINYTRGRVTVNDRPALEDCACECFGLIREQTARLLDGHAWGFNPAPVSRPTPPSDSANPE